MANDIKNRIVLEGEKEYSAALKEAQRNLKVLRSELKAETAELGKNATEQEKATAKAKNLQKQIAEQEKVVKTYEAALKEVKERYGDNEEAVAKWEIRLNDARTALANMKNSLNDVGNSMKTVEASAEQGVVAANSFADSLSKIASVGDGISSSIESAFQSVVGTITDAIADLWAQLMDTAARANAWTDIATMWNSTAGNIQKWYHAVQSEGKDFSKLSSFVTKIVTGDQNKIAESAKVSAAQYSDQWEYAMAVMDSLSKMDGSKQMKALKGMGIKGFKPEGWLDMLKAWGDIQGNLSKFNAEEGGLGLTDEELEKADRLSKAVAQLQESWTALKDHALVNLFGDLSLNITGSIQQIIDAFHEYFSAKDQEGKNAALGKIRQGIVDIFTQVIDGINEGLKLLDGLAQDLQGSDDATARALGDVLGKIVDALQWFADPTNWEAVKVGFEALIGVWAAGKVASAVGNLASFAANVATIKAGGRWLWSGPSGAGGGAGITGAAMENAVTQALTASAGGLATTFVTALTSTTGLIGVSLLMLAPVVAEALRPRTEAERKLEAAIKLLEPKTVSETVEEGLDILTNKGGKGDDAKRALQWLVTGEKPKAETGSTSVTMDPYASLPVWREPGGRKYGFKASDEQMAAAEAVWDEFKLGRVQPETQQALQDAFDNNTTTLETLYTLMEQLLQENQQSGEINPDLPAEWWYNGGNSGNNAIKTNAAAEQMAIAVTQLPKNIQEGMSSVKVVMDKEEVGRLVAPIVSNFIAGEANVPTP